MPQENPRRRRTGKTPPRYRSGPKRGQFMPKAARRRKNVARKPARRKATRRRRNLALMTVNPRRRSRPVARKKTRRRRIVRTRRKVYRRKRNPAAFGLQLPNMTTVAWGVAGYAGAQALPSLAMPGQYAAGGITSYALELGGTIAASMLAKMIGGAPAMRAALTGGGIRVAVHVLEDSGVIAKIPGMGVGALPAVNAHYPGVAPGGVGSFVDAGVAPLYPGELGAFQSDYEPHYLGSYIDSNPYG